MLHRNTHTQTHTDRERERFTVPSMTNNIPEIKFTKLFINGKFVDSVSGKTLATIDPRTGEEIARVSEGEKEDVDLASGGPVILAPKPDPGLIGLMLGPALDLAVKAARETFDHGPWPRLSGSARSKIIMKYADLVEQHAKEIASLETANNGKLFSYILGVEVPNVADDIRYAAGAADKLHGETLKMSGQYQGYTLREPIGVVGIIIPWNFPFTMFFLKVAPALAVGCTMVVKPAEQTPLSALYCAHLAKLAGIPDGVVNVVNGFGSTAGAALASHMDVDKISFTGSTAVGRLIMQAAATSNLKSVSLELGGKSPLLVFNDADIDKATDLALISNLFNKGEVCVAGSRVFVQKEIYDEFTKKLTEKMQNWPVGDPFDPKIQQGPQVSKKQFEKVLSYIELGKKEGATLLTGGKRIGQKGFYIEPTLFTDVKDDMIIAQEEIFGPVVSLMKFKTVEEAIERGNATKYGLAAGIITNDINIANTVSRSLKAGSVWINCYFAFERDCPFGGYKMSGFGKDHGIEGLKKYTQTKSVVIPIYNSPWH